MCSIICMQDSFARARTRPKRARDDRVSCIQLNNQYIYTQYPFQAIVKYKIFIAMQWHSHPQIYIIFGGP